MALPLYPSLKASLEELLLDMARAAAREELGPFNQSPRMTQHEGHRHSYTTVYGEEREIKYQEASAGMELSSTEIAALSLEDALKLVIQKGRELGAQEARYHYTTLDQIITEVGNIVSGPLSKEVLFETLEKIFITFDEEGNPRMPTLVIHPNMAPRVQELAEELEGDEEAKTRLVEIMERKREQWNEEQNRRKLVD